MKTRIVAIVLLSAFLVACGSAQSLQNRSSQERTPQPPPPTVQVTGPPTVVSHKVGDVVNVAQIWQITITKVEHAGKDRVDPIYDLSEMGANEYFLVIHMTVKNISAMQMSFSGDFQFTLRDPEGNLVKGYASPMVNGTQAAPSGTILPGMQQKGDLTYIGNTQIKSYDLLFEPNMPETPAFLWKIS